MIAAGARHRPLPATETSPRALIRYQSAKWIQIWKDAILLTEASETFRHHGRDSFPAGFAERHARRFSINCLSSFLLSFPSHIVISSHHVRQISIPSREDCRQRTSTIAQSRPHPPLLTRLSACPSLRLGRRRKVWLKHSSLLWCCCRCRSRWLHVLAACSG